MKKLKNFYQEKLIIIIDVFLFDFENDVKVIIETTEGPKRPKKSKDKNAPKTESNPKEIIPDSEDEEEQEDKDKIKRINRLFKQHKKKERKNQNPHLNQLLHFNNLLPLSTKNKVTRHLTNSSTSTTNCPSTKEQGNPPSQPTPPRQTPKPPVTTEEKSQTLDEEIDYLFKSISKKELFPSSNPKTSSSSKPRTPTVPSHQPKTPTPSPSQKQGSRASQIMAGFGEESEKSSESSGRKRVKLEEDFNEKYREACLEGSAEGLIFVEQENKTVDQKELKLITEFHATMEKQKKDKHLSWIKGFKCDLNNFSSAGASAMFNSVFPSVVNNRTQ